MKSTTERYSSPARPPRLVASAPAEGAQGTSAPMLSLRGGAAGPSRRLVSFEWGRVEPSRFGR